MRIDLHNHTKYSDGVYTPEELVLRAKRNNVDIFALTDHDSVSGVEECVKMGEKHGIRVIKGCEVSADYNGESVHIVCLFKNNIVGEGMIKYAQEFREKRRQRAINMMENMTKYYGLKVNMEEFLDTKGVLTRGNMIRHIMKYNNLTMDEARFYILPESKAYLPSTKLPVPDAIKMIRESNGIAIFAHPCLIKKEENLKEILKYDFDGIEVRYANPKNNEERFRKIALERGFLMSAGSDCHGDNSHADIGSATLNEDEFKAIAQAINFKI